MVVYADLDGVDFKVMIEVAVMPSFHRWAGSVVKVFSEEDDVPKSKNWYSSFTLQAGFQRYSMPPPAVQPM